MTNARRTTRRAPAASPAPLGLTRRRHIDLARVAGAACRPADAGRSGAFRSGTFRPGAARR